jgi:hypothetical protein
MALEDLITPANMVSYARAAIRVARTCARLGAAGYEAMIVPSRGAVPVVQHAQSYYRAILQPCMTFEDRLRKLESCNRNPLHLAFHAPFTADAGPLGLKGLTTAHIRHFWARVIASIIRGDTDCAHYRWYRFVRDEICRIGHHDGFERHLRSGKVVFIDTVVSGRAAVEIVDAFEAEGLTDIHYLLLLDENGARMDVRFASRLYQLEARGRATLVKLDSLFTEDQGPAVSAVWAVVMPDLMEEARQRIPAFSDGIIGAGLYYWEASKREDESNRQLTISLATLGTLLHQAVFIAAEPDDIAEDLDQLGCGFGSEADLDWVFRQRSLNERWFDPKVYEYLEHVHRYRLFDKAVIADLARPRLIKATATPVSIEISASHALRLKIDPADAARLIRAFEATLRKPYDS